MPFLADENLSGDALALLRRRGLDVASVIETSPGLDDPDVIRMARRLGRTPLTFDSDIGERIFHRSDPPPPGVIYLRFIQDDPEETVRVVLDILRSGEFDVRARYVTYRNGRIRHQPLPEARQ